MSKELHLKFDNVDCNIAPVKHLNADGKPESLQLCVYLPNIENTPENYDKIDMIWGCYKKGAKITMIIEVQE